MKLKLKLNKYSKPINSVMVDKIMYLEVKETKEAGRGVFATEDIPKGTVIEVCPIIEIPRGNIKETKDKNLQVQNSRGSTLYQLSRYVFDWTDSLYALALGFGSLYNHNRKPNTRHDQNYEEKTISFTALRDIKKGEEITIYYGYCIHSQTKHKKVEEQIKTLFNQEKDWCIKRLKKGEKSREEGYKRLLKIS